MSGLGQANCIHGIGLVTAVTVLKLASRAPGRQKAPVLLVSTYTGTDHNIDLTNV